MPGSIPVEWEGSTCCKNLHVITIFKENIVLVKQIYSHLIVPLC